MAWDICLIICVIGALFFMPIDFVMDEMVFSTTYGDIWNYFIITSLFVLFFNIFLKFNTGFFK